MSIRPRRSVLYMPGSNLRALEKAKTLDADCLILDLEDAVTPDMKLIAREQVCAVSDFGYREVIIRINALDTPWGMDDLAAVAKTNAHAILIPKVNDQATLMTVDIALSGTHLAIWAMMETAKAMLNAESIANTPTPRLKTFVLGTNDLAKETKTRLLKGRAPMIPWLMHTLTAARARGLTIIDGVYNDIADETGFIDECNQARDFGFDGKTLIHPSQIAGCNNAFTPSVDELAHAKAIIAAFTLPENKGKGALSINGKMTEILHAEMAKETVALAEMIANR
jgi:citrate lyase subunit beta / citryl-CoA lyase